MGLLGCLMYWVEWKTRNARPAKKSRELSRPATGRRVKPVQSGQQNKMVYIEIQRDRAPDLLTPQEVGDILQLWYVILPEAAVVHQQGKDMIVFAASVRLVELGQIPKDDAPRFDLLLRIVHMRQLLPVLVIVGNVRKVLATLAILGICEARMVRIQLRTIAQNLIGEPVQITYTTWKPGHSRRIVLVIARDDVEVAALLLQILDGLAQGTGLAIALHKELVAGHTQRGARLDVHQIDVVLLEDGQRVGQGAAGQRRVLRREQQARVARLPHVHALRYIRRVLDASWLQQQQQ